MANLSIAILGLGRIGTSIGLALKQYMENNDQHHFEITGYDWSHDNRKLAEKMGAIDIVVSKDFEAVAEKDIIILDLSYDQMEQTFQSIAADLRDGVVLLDFSPLKQPSIDWAEKYFSEENHLVGASAILNTKYLYDNNESIQSANEDLFEEGLMLLAPSATCIREAVDLAFSFSTLLGAKPHFFDPTELDNLLAFTEGLPSILGFSVFYEMSNNKGWNDIQRLANSPTGALTRTLYDHHPDALRDYWLNSGENLIRILDNYIATLTEVRSVLAEKDQDAVEAILVETAENYHEWYARRQSGDWGDLPKSSDDTRRNVMSTLFGSYLADRMSGGRNKND